jgi:hypothetical protein
MDFHVTTLQVESTQTDTLNSTQEAQMSSTQDDNTTQVEANQSEQKDEKQPDNEKNPKSAAEYHEVNRWMVLALFETTSLSLQTE